MRTVRLPLVVVWPGVVHPQEFFMLDEVVPTHAGVRPRSSWQVAMDGGVDEPPPTSPPSTPAPMCGAASDVEPLLWARNAVITWQPAPVIDVERDEDDAGDGSSDGASAGGLPGPGDYGTAAGNRDLDHDREPVASAGAGARVGTGANPGAGSRGRGCGCCRRARAASDDGARVPLLSVDVVVVGDGGPHLPPAPTLRGVSVLVRPGELVAVVGPVGGGKTTLALACMGEVSAAPAKAVGVRGRVMLCPQTPWIRSASIRDNITMCAQGVPAAVEAGASGDCAAGADAAGADVAGAVNAEALEAAVRACALVPDLDILPCVSANALDVRGAAGRGGETVSRRRACWVGVLRRSGLPTAWHCAPTCAVTRTHGDRRPAPEPPPPVHPRPSPRPCPRALNVSSSLRALAWVATPGTATRQRLESGASRCRADSGSA